MQKDGKRFAGTGGWGFEGFAAGDPARPVVGQIAHWHHTPRNERSAHD